MINFIEKVDHAHQKIFEGKTRLKEIITKKALKRNRMASDLSW